MFINILVNLITSKVHIFQIGPFLNVEILILVKFNQTKLSRFQMWQKDLDFGAILNYNVSDGRKNILF